MNTLHTLHSLESQLACPTGSEGLRIANMMHDTNVNMTLQGWRQLRLNPNGRVLELGHGNAAHVTPLLEKRRDVHYTGLEVSDLMCEQAQLFNANMVQYRRAQFWHYDGQTLPCFLQAFDGILSVNNVYFWENPRDLLRQLRQQLSPLGRLVLVYMDVAFLNSLPFVGERFECYEPHTLETLLAQTGFGNIQTRSFEDQVLRPDGTALTRMFHSTCATHTRH